ncbi:MAG: hypothetical protein ACJAWS_000173 [Oleiphilaceae bacterium]|jgi:hypothetical protein
MHSFRKTNKRLLAVWSILLSLLMLNAQGVTLHVHNIEHDPLQNHHSIDDLNDHSYLKLVHLTTDSSHEGHHADVTSEINACPDCLVNQVLSKITMIALQVMALIWILLVVCRTDFPRIHSNIKHPWRHYISPQLRAPPL